MLWGCNPRALSDPVSRCQLALPHHPLASSPVHQALQHICSSHVTDFLMSHFWKFGHVKEVFCAECVNLQGKKVITINQELQIYK